MEHRRGDGCHFDGDSRERQDQGPVGLTEFYGQTIRMPDNRNGRPKNGYEQPEKNNDQQQRMRHILHQTVSSAEKNRDRPQADDERNFLANDASQTIGGFRVSARFCLSSHEGEHIESVLVMQSGVTQAPCLAVSTDTFSAIMQPGARITYQAEMPELRRKQEGR